jgi:hypothetical protein
MKIALENYICRAMLAYDSLSPSPLPFSQPQQQLHIFSNIDVGESNFAWGNFSLGDGKKERI